MRGHVILRALHEVGVRLAVNASPPFRTCHDGRMLGQLGPAL